MMQCNCPDSPSPSWGGPGWGAVPHSGTEKESPFFLTKRRTFLQLALCGTPPHPNPPHKGEGTVAVTMPCKMR